VTKICQEIELLIKIDHVNVVKIYEYYIYTSDIFIVMEFLNGGELFYRITEHRNSMTLGFVRNIMIQLLESLSYMHFHNIGTSNLSALRFET
jgi:serine/threonine protein kinase